MYNTVIDSSQNKNKPRISNMISISLRCQNQTYFWYVWFTTISHYISDIASSFTVIILQSIRLKMNEQKIQSIFEGCKSYIEAFDNYWTPGRIYENQSILIISEESAVHVLRNSLRAEIKWNLITKGKERLKIECTYHIMFFYSSGVQRSIQNR